MEFNAAAMKASAEGAQFAVSQSVVNVDDPLWQNALDIIIPNLSVSAHKKELFVNAELSIVHGRRYLLMMCDCFWCNMQLVRADAAFITFLRTLLQIRLGGPQRCR